MAARGGSEAGAAAGLGRPWARIDALRLGRRAKGGERAAFEEIFRRHHQELYRYCLAIVRDRDDAEDALQATMAAALRALPGERRELAVRPWLFRVAHNESVSILRGRRERDPEVTAIADPSPSQEAEVATRERLRALVADLGELPERQRAAIVMRELSGLSHAEIGAALSCGEAAARQAVYEARTALREREEGREMECERVRVALSDRDGRRLRSRRMRAHLSACDGCRGFAASISQRRSDLEALCPPLPAAAAATILGGLVGGAGPGAAAGGLGTAGAAGGGLAATAAVKGGSLVAALAIAAGAAEIGGVMPDLSNPLGKGADRRDAPPAAGGDGALAGRGAGEEPPPAAGGGLERSSGRAGGSGARDGDRGEAGGGRGGAAGARAEGGDSGAHRGGNPGDADPIGPEGAGGSPASNAGGGGRSTAPGQTGTSPGGGTATAPGQTGAAGNSAAAPGRSGTAGNPGSAPDETQPPGAAAAPGRTGEPPAAAGGGSGRGGNSSK